MVRIGMNGMPLLSGLPHMDLKSDPLTDLYPWHLTNWLTFVYSILQFIYLIFFCAMYCLLGLVSCCKSSYACVILTAVHSVHYFMPHLRCRISSFRATIGFRFVVSHSAVIRRHRCSFIVIRSSSFCDRIGPLLCKCSKITNSKMYKNVQNKKRKKKYQRAPRQQRLVSTIVV